MTFLDDVSSFQNDPFGIMGTQNSIQRSLEDQIARLRAGANKKNSPGTSVPTPPPNPLELLQQQLFSQINALPSFTTPLDQLRAQAQSQVNSQFDPLIAALQGNIKSTTSRSQANQKSAKSMYNDLATDLASQIPDITNQMRQAQDAASQRYAQAAQNSKADYQQQADQQHQILNQLGLQSVQQDTQANSQADQQYFQNQNDLQKQSALDALQQQQNSAQTYQQGLSNSSRLAGDNAAQQLQDQLSQYLDQANTQLGGLQSQKSSSFQALLQQLQSADAQNAQQQRQNQIDNLMKMFNFQLSTQKEIDAQQRAASQDQKSKFSGTKGPQGAANYLAESLGPDRTNTASQILKLINDTMANPNVVAGHHAELDKNGNAVKDPMGRPININNTDQYIEDLLRSRMEQSYGGFSTGDINSAINALLAYMGKLG